MSTTLSKWLASNSAALGLLSKLSNRQVRMMSAQGSTADLFHEMLPSLERFRYEVYIAELKKSLPQADHLNCRLPDEDDLGAHHFIATTKQFEVDGCIRLHVSPAVPDAVKQALRLDNLLAGYRSPYGYVSKLMVRRTLRGGFVVLKLLEAMEQFSHNHFADGELGFFHCHPKLTRLYERYGFRKFGTMFNDPNVGQQVPMYFMIRDAEYFKEIGSPLYWIAKKRPIQKEVKEHLLTLLHSEGGNA